MFVLLPTTSATAIVSPSARPRPSMPAPTMPGRAVGSTPSRIVSYRVAPSAMAPSRVSVDTTLTTSRVTAVTMGRIMIARITPAVNRSPPGPAYWNTPPITGTLPTDADSHGCTVWSNNGTRT